MKNLPPANYPAFLTQKGTMIRLRCELASGFRFVAEPLRSEAGGLLLDSEVAKPYLEVPDLPSVRGFYLLSHEGHVVSSIVIPDDSLLQRIESLVVYPDGSTWEGRIFSGVESQLGLVVWSWDLAHHVKLDNRAETFGFTEHWSEVPTTVGFLPHENMGGCFRTEHTCPACDFSSKVL